MWDLSFGGFIQRFEKVGDFGTTDFVATPVDEVDARGDRLPLVAILTEFALHGSKRLVAIVVQAFAQIVQGFVVADVVGYLPRLVVGIAVVFLLGWFCYFHGKWGPLSGAGG